MKSDIGTVGSRLRGRESLGRKCSGILGKFRIFLLLGACAAGAAERPNVVFILCDDLGYGDVQCLNSQGGRIATPNMDRLAAQGMVFTDAHSSSSVCTPSRYSILTGRYNWRSRLKENVLYGLDAPLIEEDRPTLPGFLRKQGYVTGCIGKWHLGLMMPTLDGKPPKAEAHRSTKNDKDDGTPIDTNIDWKGTIRGGPNAIGFDYFYGISASLDMPPYIWIENDRFVGECTVIKTFHRAGPAHKDFEASDVLGTLARKGVGFVQTNKEKPFFLYLALTSPHTPIVPSKEWLGKSGLGPYADFVMETDWAIGEIAKALDEGGLSERTLFVVTSDNGCSPSAKAAMKE